MKPQLNAILNKRMNRKDFLKHMAVAGVMLAGGGMVFQSLGGLEKLGAGKKQTQQKTSYGYGDSVYGGHS